MMMRVENLQAKDRQTDPNSTRTIILWGPDGLLTWYMNYLLGGKSNCQVIRLYDEVDTTRLLHEIEKLHPNIVIVYQEQEQATTILPRQILAVRPEVKVITVNLENNFLEVQNQQKIRIRTLADFLAVIES